LYCEERRNIHRVQTSCPAELAKLKVDLDTQDIVTLNLTRAVQLIVDIGTHLISKSQEPAPGSMGKTFDSFHNLGMIDAALSTRL